ERLDVGVDCLPEIRRHPGRRACRVLSGKGAENEAQKSYGDHKRAVAVNDGQITYFQSSVANDGSDKWHQYFHDHFQSSKTDTAKGVPLILSQLLQYFFHCRLPPVCFFLFAPFQ